MAGTMSDRNPSGRGDERHPMVGSRHFPVSLDGLGRRYALGAAAIKQLASLASLLAFDEHAPTTVRGPSAVRDDHLADSLVALELAEVRTAERIADLGAGAGLPGLPLAIALPATHVTLIEGSRRKCDFIESAATALGLENVDVIHGRAETWEAGIGSCDLVTARALAPLDVVEEYAAPLLSLGGTLVVWRGRRDPDAEDAGARAAAILGLQVQDPIPVVPYPRAEHRHLHRLRKAEPTPPRFPRRDGVARKRPLGRV